MKLLDVINKTEHETWANMEEFTFILGLQHDNEEYDEWDSRVRKYFICGANWICTDSRVGVAVYKFDGEVVAVSTQSGRKNSEDVYFVSNEVANKVKSFILTLLKEPKHSIVDLNEEIDSWYFRQGVNL